MAVDWLLSAGFGTGMVAACLWRVALNMSHGGQTLVPAPTADRRRDNQLPVLSGEVLLNQAGTVELRRAFEAKFGFTAEHLAHSVRPVLVAYAEYVQQLPASESHHHAQPGGLLIHALEVVDFALALRRGQILPAGAPAEDAMRLEHRWTYAVFLAALLHDIGKLIVDLRVTLDGSGWQAPAAWAPLAGPMSEYGAQWYHVDFARKAERDYAAHEKLPILLFQRIVPPEVVRWLSQDRPLMTELIAVLAGDQEREGGVLRKLVSRADAQSVSRNLLAGSRVRFARARRVPLIERLMAAMRNRLEEGGALPLNRSGAAGWVYHDHIWFVSKRLADDVREYLQRSSADEDGVPSDNQRLFDTWQEYGALVTNPETGKAVWNVLIEGIGYSHALTVLCFPIDRLYSRAESRPVPMLGRVVVMARKAGSHNTADAIDHETNGAAGVTASVCKEETKPAKPQVPIELQGDSRRLDKIGMKATALPEGPASDEEEYLEDVEDSTTDRLPTAKRACPVPRPSAPTVFAPISPAWVGPPTIEDGSAKRVPEVALRFMGWLQAGIADGSLPFNQAGAMVHFVPEGMLLVSPRIFKHFEQRNAPAGEDASTSSEKAKAPGLATQKEVLKAGWHLREDKGVNILRYAVRRPGKPGAFIAGVVIVEPQRFVYPVPVANPYLIRAIKAVPNS